MYYINIMIHKLKKIKKILESILSKKKKIYWLDKNKFFIDTKNIVNYEFIRWAKKQEYSKDIGKDKFIYEKYQTELFESYIKNSKSFVDIGCQIGFYSLIANEYDNIKNILSLDISKECIKATKINFKNNSYKNKNIIISNEALGPKNITYSFWAEKSKKDGKSLKEILINNNLSLTKKDVIKIDIEGYEYSYFDTIQNYIKETKPILFFSLHKEFIENLSNNNVRMEYIIKDLRTIYPVIYYVNDHISNKFKISNISQIPQNDLNPVLVCHDS